MPAELEEVVVGADLLGAENAAPELRHGILHRRHGARCTAARGAPRDGGLQRAPVDLSLRGEREGIQAHEPGRNHVAGKAAGECPPHPFGVAVLVRDQIGHELRRPSVGPRHHCGRADARRGDEGRLDFTRLDAKAADLYLAVAPAEELDPAVGAPAHGVSGAVQARAGRPERVRHEAVRRQAGSPRIAARHAVAAHVKIAGGAHRHGPHRLVQHIDARVRDGAPDGHAVAHRLPGHEPMAACEGGGLGGAIAVHDPAAAGGEQAAHVGRRENITAGEHLFYVGKGVRLRVDDQVEKSGGEPDHRHGKAPEESGNVRGGSGAGRCDGEFPPPEQRAVNLERGRVEGYGCELEQRLAGPELRELGAEHQAQHVAVRYFGPLRFARGARREHHVRETLGARARRRERCGRPRGGAELLEGDEGEGSAPGRRAAVGHEKTRPRIGEQARGSRAGRLGVEGDVGPARPENA